MSNPSKRYRLICKLCNKEILEGQEINHVRLSMLDPVKYNPDPSGKSWPDIVHASCFKKALRKEMRRGI